MDCSLPVTYDVTRLTRSLSFFTLAAGIGMGRTLVALLFTVKTIYPVNISCSVLRGFYWFNTWNKMPLKFVKLGRPFCGQPLNLKGSLKHVSLESHSISPFSAVISLLMPFYAIKCLSRRKSFIKYYIVLAHKHQESWVVRKDIFRLKSSKQLLL